MLGYRFVVGMRRLVSLKAALAVCVLGACFGLGTIPGASTCAADGDECPAKLEGMEWLRLDVRALQEISDLTLYPLFIRGDANRDRAVTVMDGIVILEALFEEGTELTCPDAADVNDDGFVDISDPIALFAYLFAGGLAPPAPCSCEGPDPTPDRLGCE